MKASRTLVPGSEWLYFKLYTGIKSADTLLVQHIHPILMQLQDRLLIRQFFFIRYTDPHFHLRLRLHLSDERQLTEIFACLRPFFEACIQNGLLWNVQLDTYNREVERYGVHTVELAESIFCVDSNLIMLLIAKLGDHREGETHRWLLALVLIDDTLSMAGYHLTQKRALLQGVSEAFKQEFNFTTHAYKQQLSTRYREHKTVLFEVMDDHSRSPLKEYIPYLDNRKAQMEPYLEQLIVANSRNTPMLSLDALMTSFIHMTMNRLFRSKNRLHEMVIYDFMHRYYTSGIAKNKSTSTI